MSRQLHLKRKYSYRANGRSIVLVKKSIESEAHVLMKAFLWALYGARYPGIQVEIPIEDRYKPDLVAFPEPKHPHDPPLFWGEAGKVSASKMAKILKQYPHTHFAFARWNGPTKPYRIMAEQCLRKHPHPAPIDILTFNEETVAHFIADDGQISLGWEDVRWERI